MNASAPMNRHIAVALAGGLGAAMTPLVIALLHAALG